MRRERHTAAALALVGWYLMMPPLYKEGVSIRASVSDWEEQQAFDTADGCERARKTLQHCGAVLNGAGESESVQQACGHPGKPRPLADKEQDRNISYMALQYMESICIATDDPRLKEK